MISYATDPEHIGSVLAHMKLRVAPVQDRMNHANPEEEIPSVHTLEVSLLRTEEGKEILLNYLKAHKRVLTDKQEEEMMKGITQCPSPLWIRIAVERARSWRSFDECISLPVSVTGLIEMLFDRLERDHGFELVSSFTSYITLARCGLSITEVQGLLSLNDRVLGDVYQFWAPPVRVLPPMLMLR